jgi:hypothetical protein
MTRFYLDSATATHLSGRELVVDEQILAQHIGEPAVDRCKRVTTMGHDEARMAAANLGGCG